MGRRNLRNISDAYFKRLNDLDLSTRIVRKALELYSEEKGLDEQQGAGRTSAKFHFSVPAGGKPTARISRSQRSMRRLLDDARNEGEYRKSLVLAVSIVEDYLRNMCRAVLRARPERLLVGMSGKETMPTIPLNKLVTRDHASLIDEQILRRLNSMLYAQPRKYLRTIADILDIEPDVDGMERFAEIKATRDVVVHAENVADDRYVAKAGEHRRGSEGDRLTVDEAYFLNALGIMKRLITDVHQQVVEAHGEDAAVQAEARRFFE